MPQSASFPTGVWQTEKARRRHWCRGDWRHHKIQKGDLFLSVTNSGTGSLMNFCQPCAIALLDRAAAGIRELRSELSTQAPGQVSAGE